MQQTDSGLIFNGLSYDFSKIMQRKDKIVGGFTRGIDSLFKKNKIEWIKGNARLKSPHEIEVDGQLIEAKFIILATGSEPIQLPILPFDEKRIVSSTGALVFEKPPKKLLVVGAGIIGVELGSVYRRLGSEVIFIEFLDRICATFDRSLCQALEKSLTAQGMVFHLSHKVIKADPKTLTLTAQGPEKEMTLQGDAILVCVGRRPYSENLGLENAGIRLDPKGFVPIDDSFRTAQPHIFAIGDLVNGPMLAHKASEEGVAVAELIAGHHPIIDYLCIPSVAYTYPEVAAVGLTEEEALARKIPIKKGQFPFKANSRAKCVSEEDGFVKMICEADSHRLLGVHIIGPHASELITEATLALKLKATVEEISSTPHAHPTLSEALKEAALATLGHAIHF